MYAHSFILNNRISVWQIFSLAATPNLSDGGFDEGTPYYVIHTAFSSFGNMHLDAAVTDLISNGGNYGSRV